MNLDLPCIQWQGHIAKNGYGKFNGKLVHRVAYEAVYGPIPDGMTIDHVCHTVALQNGTCESSVCLHRSCVEVEHMEIVSQGVNSLRGGSPAALNSRKTHCPRGHPYNESNTFIDTNGHRNCRICHFDRQHPPGARPNQKRFKGQTASGYKGVYQNTNNRWQAVIRIDGKTVCLGTYDTIEEAAIVYNNKAVEAHGENAILNDIRGVV